MNERQAEQDAAAGESGEYHRHQFARGGGPVVVGVAHRLLLFRWLGRGRWGVLRRLRWRDGSLLGVRVGGVDGDACAGGAAGADGVCPAASAVCSAWPARAVPSFGPPVAAPLTTAAPTATPAATGPAVAALPPPVPAELPPGVPPLLGVVPVAAGVVFGGGGVLLPVAGRPPVVPLSLVPSSTFFGSPPTVLLGTGIGRFRAFLASCSEPMAWYMSNPTNVMNL